MNQKNKFGKRQVNVVGHPGTGKTTTLGELVYNYARDSSDNLNFNGLLGANFSRGAAYALKQTLRAYGLPLENFKHFRTIHSLAAKTLDLKERSQFVQPADCKLFFSQYGIPYEGKQRTIDDIDIYGYVGDPVSFVLGNQILGYFQYLKRVLIIDEEITRKIRRHWHIERFKDLKKQSSSFLLTLYRSWENFKKERGKSDFDDMLQTIIQDELPFMGDIEFAIVDEGQDLSPIQIGVLKEWLQDADLVYVAFDPMQTLYFFNGVNPHLIRGLKNDDEMLLSKSYRVPEIPWENAKEFAHRNRCFTVDKVNPTDREGGVIWANKDKVFDTLKKVNGQKKTFALFRNNASVFKFADECLRRGIYHKGLGRVKSAFDEQVFVWQHNLMAKLINGLPLEYEEVRSIITKIPAKGYLKRGVQTDFDKRRGKFWDSNDQRRLGDVDTHAHFYSLFRKRCGNVDEVKEIIADPNVMLSYGKRGEHKKEFLLSLTTTASPIRVINSYIGTYHAAKGREADEVILFDYLLPKSTTQYEENCICFTGLTRTKDVDYIVPVAGYGGRGFMEKVLVG